MIGINVRGVMASGILCSLMFAAGALMASTALYLAHCGDTNFDRGVGSGAGKR